MNHEFYNSISTLNYVKKPTFALLNIEYRHLALVVAIGDFGYW